MPFIITGTVTVALSVMLAGQSRPVTTTMVPLFVPVDIAADVSGLPENERQVLARIVDAARVMDGLFLEQVWPGNPALLIDLVGDTDRPRARASQFLPDQQGAVVASRGEQPVHSRRAAEAGKRRLLPAGCDA